MGQPGQPARPSFNMATLSTSSKILLGAGILFFIDTFLPWQRVCAGGGNVAGVDIPGFCVSANAWGGNAGFLGILAGLLALAMVAWEGMQVANVNMNLNVPASRVSAALAGGTLLFGVIKFIIALTNHPGLGAFIGIILLAAIAYGGYMKWQEPATTGPGIPPGPGTAPPPGGFTT
jgi:hypothetical protein